MLTVRQAAARLQIGEVTVLRWLRAGKLAGVKPGGTRIGWRIDESELDRLLAPALSVPWGARAEAPPTAIRAATADDERHAAGVAQLLAQAEAARVRGDEATAARCEALAGGMVGATREGAV